VTHRGLDYICRKFRHAFLNNSIAIAGNVSGLGKINIRNPRIRFVEGKHG
jgi:hypothetical protein